MSYNSSQDRGSIVIENETSATLTDWTLTMTVPGGQRLTATGPVLGRQSGQSVTITPAGSLGAIDAGAVLSFTFTVAVEPENCALNGRACS